MKFNQRLINAVSLVNILKYDYGVKYSGITANEIDFDMDGGQAGAT